MTGSMESAHDEKNSTKEVERITTDMQTDDRIEFGWRTVVALLSMLLLNFVELTALIAPPTALSFIEADLNAPTTGIWVPNSLSLVQAVLCPVVSFASDAFQARKWIVVGTSALGFVASCIAARSDSIGQLIAAQSIMGIALSNAALAYAIPAEILPRRWRPLSQAFANAGATMGGVVGPFCILGFLKNNPSGWKNFYWVLAGVWGLTVVTLIIAYNPPPRSSAVRSAPLSKQIAALDLPGAFLLACGLVLLIVGLNEGGQIYPWNSATVISLIVVGIVMLGVWGAYEVLIKKDGILHRELCNRNVLLMVFLIGLEGPIGFAIFIFYPALTAALYDDTPLGLAIRYFGFFVCAVPSTLIFGFWATKARGVKWPLFVGFTILMGGMIGLSCIQPGNSALPIGVLCMMGFGFGSPLILIVSGVQFYAPHKLIGTVTALVTSARSVFIAVIVAIYSSAIVAPRAAKVPENVIAAAIGAGLPPQSAGSFVGPFLGNAPASVLFQIPGVTPAVLGAAGASIPQTLADAFRYVYVVAACLCALAALLCFLIPNDPEHYTLKVDAPVEKELTLHHAHLHAPNTEFVHGQKPVGPIAAVV